VKKYFIKIAIRKLIALFMKNSNIFASMQGRFDTLDKYTHRNHVSECSVAPVYGFISLRVEISYSRVVNLLRPNVATPDESCIYIVTVKNIELVLISKYLDRNEMKGEV